MLACIDEYIRYAYSSHKFTYALLVLLIIIVMGAGMETLARLLTAKGKTRNPA